jgi:alpha-tubulin suppressor-like RCC1 family protein
MDNHGQLGYDGPSSGTPTQVAGVGGASDLACGWFTTCVLSAGNGFYCWGDYGNGEFGADPSSTDAGMDGSGQNSAPTLVTNPIGASSLSMRDFNQGVVGAGGQVAWWPNYLSDGGLSFPPYVQPDVAGAVGISSGGDHWCALLGNGGVRCWGVNANGQLGIGTLVTPDAGDFPPSFAVQGITDAIALATANSTTCALHGSGTVSCWGLNAQGQVGNGNTTDSPVPTAVIGATDVTAIGAGDYHFCMIKTDGSIWCWGANYQGQLGDGTTNNQSTPVQVQGL